ncbi:MAG: gamma-glutamyl phosphate reductase [uncultured bacterium]|nr:MAG: gamma-glutamyl phosphate reductase [uncultured bacterium]HBY74236.1 glutamate-5-semialdehyde dehydrogenase [Candidatus Kerfeldbacteria bacterium]
MTNPKLSRAKLASRSLAQLSNAKRDVILGFLAHELIKQTTSILKANAKDLARVPRDYAMRDRLTLTKQRIADMAKSLHAVQALPDPLGLLLDKTTRSTGLVIQRRSVPLGLVAVIYEARPNVTIEVAGLCIKTGNAVALKGGSDAYYSNVALVRCVHLALRRASCPTSGVVLVTGAEELLRAHGVVDVAIPRGSNRLIQFVRETATVPVIETGAGVCHTLVEKTADVKLAAKVITNAKVRRCTVCNSIDCLVVEQPIAKKLFNELAPLLLKHRVELRADQPSYALLQKVYPQPLLKRAKADDFGHEFLALRMSIKTVQSAQAGIAFVQNHTSGHSEAIITRNQTIAQAFQQQVDAAAVYVNTSTAFTDGFEFGLGAEVGISTQKLHARGPMGLTALTTYKWFVTSHGATRHV